MEPISVFDVLISRVKADWYEVAHLGLAAQVKCRLARLSYVLSLRKRPVDQAMEFPELEWDLDCGDADQHRRDRRLAVAYSLILGILLAISAGLAVAGEACQAAEVIESFYKNEGMPGSVCGVCRRISSTSDAVVCRSASVGCGFINIVNLGNGRTAKVETPGQLPRGQQVCVTPEDMLLSSAMKPMDLWSQGPDGDVCLQSELTDSLSVQEPNASFYLSEIARYRRIRMLDLQGRNIGRMTSAGDTLDAMGRPTGRMDDTGRLYVRGLCVGRVGSTGRIYDRSGQLLGRLDTSDRGYERLDDLFPRQAP